MNDEHRSDRFDALYPTADKRPYNCYPIPDPVVDPDRVDALFHMAVLRGLALKDIEALDVDDPGHLVLTPEYGVTALSERFRAAVYEWIMMDIVVFDSDFSEYVAVTELLVELDEEEAGRVFGPSYRSRAEELWAQYHEVHRLDPVPMPRLLFG